MSLTQSQRLPVERMTATEFEALQPRLQRLTVGSFDIARAVFVEGIRPIDVAARHGTSRQRISAIVRRVQEARNAFPATWRRVEVWLPPELAAQVERMAEDARAHHGHALHKKPTE